MLCCQCCCPHALQDCWGTPQQMEQKAMFEDGHDGLSEMNAARGMVRLHDCTTAVVNVSSSFRRFGFVFRL